MEKNIIYVELEEGSGTPVFAPVSAKYLGDKFYEILPLKDSINDTAKFKSGAYVFCLISELRQGKYPVAYKEVSKKMVNYILDIK